MTHQALARKYRPQSFDEMVGQTPVVQTLKNALGTGKIHPAYIFSGIRGVGKTTAARLFAKGLNCEKGPTATPCNACPSCAEISAARSMDVLEIDGATNTQAEEARDLMQAARYMPVRDRRRVFIIDEVHMLSKAAFNALLKTLEEPPAHAVFLLATTEPHRIPETIHSRSQHFQFRRVPNHKVAQFLQEVCRREGIEADPAALDLVAKSGEGSVRDSLTLLDRLQTYTDAKITEEVATEALGILGRDALDSLVRVLAAGDAAAVSAFVEGLSERGQSLERFLSDLIELVRQLVRVRAKAEPQAGEPPEEEQRLAGLAALFSLEDLLRLWDLLMATLQRLKGSPDPEALLELQLVKAALLPRILPLDRLLSGGLPKQAAAAEAPPAPKEPAQAPEQEGAGEGLRFKALIPFKRMDEVEAQSYEGVDERVARFKALAAQKVPLVGAALERAGISLDPEGVLHVSFAAGSATAVALLASPERKAQVEAVAREAGYPGRVFVEKAQPEPEAVEEAPPEPPVEKDQAVEKVLKLLGGQVIKVVPVTDRPQGGGSDAEPE